ANKINTFFVRPKRLYLKNKIIYELKPFNPRSIKAGEKQLQMYKEELESMPQFKGIEFKTVLDTY
ncbi:MAG: hypothetical protein QM528_08735, partial [Phycisphaerales bacterium]|nr:hypothetical protein [Phycisphaerales bacterium]